MNSRREFLQMFGLTAAGLYVAPKHVFYSFAAAPLIGDTLIIHRLGGEIDRIWVNPAAHTDGGESRLKRNVHQSGRVTVLRDWTCGEMGLDTAEAAERRRTSPYRIMSIDVLAGDEFIRKVSMPAPEPYFGQLAIKMTAPNYR